MTKDDPKDREHPTDQRRQHYRIPYPLMERPRLAIGGREHEIIDLSEKGVKFYLGKDDFCLLADPAVACIQREGKEAASLEGRILLLRNQTIQFVPKARALYTVIRQASAQSPGLFTAEIFRISLSALLFKPDRIECLKAANLLLEQMPPLDAQVFLYGQESYSVSGRIVRIEDHRSALYLSDEIPFKTIVAEQLRLRQKYLGFY
jgi:hypothetical protein